MLSELWLGAVKSVGSVQFLAKVDFRGRAAGAFRKARRVIIAQVTRQQDETSTT